MTFPPQHPLSAWTPQRLFGLLEAKYRESVTDSHRRIRIIASEYYTRALQPLLPHIKALPERLLLKSNTVFFQLYKDGIRQMSLPVELDDITERRQHFFPIDIVVDSTDPRIIELVELVEHRRAIQQPYHAFHQRLVDEYDGVTDTIDQNAAQLTVEAIEQWFSALAVLIHHQPNKGAISCASTTN